MADACVRDDSTECDCARCGGAEDSFWRDQGEGAGDEMPPHEFDLSDLDDVCAHLFNDDGCCELCGADYNPAVHGHRVNSGAMS